MNSFASIRLIALTGLATVLISGCAHRESGPSGIVGSWKGDGSSLTNPSMKALAEAMNVNLKQDHSFTASIGISMEGTWSEAGKTVTLKLTKLGGSDLSEWHKLAAESKGTTDNLDKPLILELSANGKTLTVTQLQTGQPQTPMVFKKKE